MAALQQRGGIISFLSQAAYFFCVGLIFHIVLKGVFNLKSDKKIPFDKWSIMDLITAVLNIVAVYAITSITVDDLNNPNIKDFTDYFMILVLAVSWVRFFMYFLVVRSVSQLLLTLVEMVADTLAFIFIVACFILIMASIFTTLYQDVNPNRDGSLSTTVRMLFDAAMAVYDYNNYGGRITSYSILIVFYVFCSNVLLLNYLIAILSTTYDNMKQSGIFKYKKNLYQYCERFVTAFGNEGYGEMVLHPPPLSYACLVLLPFINDPRRMVSVSKKFSIAMFWVENAVMFTLFFFYEVMLLPFAYVKTLVSIVFSVEAGVLRKIGLVLYWLLAGLVIDATLIYSDFKDLLFVLRQLNGFSAEDKQEEALSVQAKIEILNLARDCVIILFKTLKNHFRAKSGPRLRGKRSSGGNSSRKRGSAANESRSEVAAAKKEASDSESSYNFSDQSDLENFDIQEELALFENNLGEYINANYNPNDQDCLYVIKKSTILEDWKIRRKLMIEDKIQHNKGGQATPTRRASQLDGRAMGKNQRAMSVVVAANEEGGMLKENNGTNIKEDESALNNGFIDQKFSQKYV